MVRYKLSRGFQKSPASQREIANLVRKSPGDSPKNVGWSLVCGEAQGSSVQYTYLNTYLLTCQKLVERTATAWCHWCSNADTHAGTFGEIPQHDHRFASCWRKFAPQIPDFRGDMFPPVWHGASSHYFILKGLLSMRTSMGGAGFQPTIFHITSNIRLQKI